MAGWAVPLVLSLFVTGVVFQSQFSLRCLNRLGLPGRPFQSVHFVEFATCCAARIASHSVGATTPTRLPLTTTCAFGNRVLSNSPADTSLVRTASGATRRPAFLLGGRESVPL